MKDTNAGMGTGLEIFPNKNKHLGIEVIGDDLLALLGFTLQDKLTLMEVDAERNYGIKVMDESVYIDKNVLKDLAAKCEQLEKKNRQLLELNKSLTFKNGQLELTLKKLASRQKLKRHTLLFPEDFIFYGEDNGELNDQEVQEIINQLADEYLEEEKFQYISAGNTAVIRMNAGDMIITMVTRGFYETENTNVLYVKEMS